MKDEIMTAVISNVLFGREFPADMTVTGDVFDEMKAQSIAALPYYGLDNLPMDDGLRNEWKQFSSQQVLRYARTAGAQSKLLSVLDAAGINSVVLKGSSASVYYPHPELRMCGDVDILVKPELYEKAGRALEDAGCSCPDPYYGERHTHFRYGDTLVELHRSFSVTDDRNADEKFDRMIFGAMDRAEDHRLPDRENGLVILQHLNIHLMTGIGLRQFIDWMMFADAKLDDGFLSLADSAGLRDLAISATQLCQQYLGLREIVPEDDRSALWEYLIESGNFGRKTADSLEKRTGAALTARRSLADWIKLPYRSGLIHLRLEPRWYRVPYVWLYGAGRYIVLLIRGGHPFRTLSEGKKSVEAKREKLSGNGITRYGSDNNKENKE